MTTLADWQKAASKVLLRLVQDAATHDINVVRDLDLTPLIEVAEGEPVPMRAARCACADGGLPGSEGPSPDCPVHGDPKRRNRE